MNIRLVINTACSLLILLAVSCKHDPNKIRRRDLIPVNELVPLMTDLYLGDGLLQYPSVRNMFASKDTISSYIDIIKQHGYTKAQLDKTIQYYFVNDPKKLQKIYDQVLARLSEIQLRFQTDKSMAPKITNNLWNQKPAILVPEDGTDNSVYFNVPIKDTGYFSLTLSVLIFKNDQSVDPRVTVYFWKSDSAGNMLKKMWGKADLSKDGIMHNYSVTGRLSDTSYRHISGYLLDSNPLKGRWQKHAKIVNILLIKGVPE
ncbi:MAG: DUF4296 domain-containing protein [Bacteroidales bacterium]|jgi:hypothetical protein